MKSELPPWSSLGKMSMSVIMGNLQEWIQILAVLSSLFLQIILILLGNWRRRSSNKVNICILWSAYQLAYWIPTFALGRISNIFRSSASASSSKDLMALWAPCLLLHLGAPDTITAFSHEDNELWMRHAVGLVPKTFAVGYIFFKFMPRHLILPGGIIFVIGILKYGEKTVSLYLGSMNGLRRSLTNDPDPGPQSPNYTETMERFTSRIHAGIPAKIDVLSNYEGRGSDPTSSNCPSCPESRSAHREDANLKTVSQAYKCFKIFRRIFVDLILSKEETKECVSDFTEGEPSHAFELIEIELGFAYDIFYTKALVAHNRFGRLFRIASVVLVSFACILFLGTEKKDYQKMDVLVTYSLLFGSLALEFVSVLFLLFSNRTIVLLINGSNCGYSKEWQLLLISKFLRLLPRWSNHMGQYRLLTYCIQCHRPFVKLLCCRTQDQPPRGFLTSMKEKWIGFRCTNIHHQPNSHHQPRGCLVKWLKETWICFLKLLKEKCIGFRCTESVKVTEILKESIFKYLKKKKEDLGKTPPEQALKHLSKLYWSLQVDFDEALLLWHIATDICFYVDTPQRIDDKNHKEVSKGLSLYLLYLQVVRPFTMSSTSVLGKVRYRDTCAEVMEFFDAVKFDGDEAEACKMLINENPHIEAKKVKGDKSKSVLWDAVRLAKELRKLPNMWNTISDVWNLMLHCTASSCRGNFHAQMLSDGGELLTFVWFIEAHFGMGNLYKIKEGPLSAAVVGPDHKLNDADDGE